MNSKQVLRCRSLADGTETFQGTLGGLVATDADSGFQPVTHQNDDAGIMRLVSLKNLESLSIEETKVTQKGIDHFLERRNDVSLYIDFSEP